MSVDWNVHQFVDMNANRWKSSLAGMIEIEEMNLDVLDQCQETTNLTRSMRNHPEYHPDAVAESVADNYADLISRIPRMIEVLDACALDRPEAMVMAQELLAESCFDTFREGK